MTPLALLLVAVGVSADAFAVSVGKGLAMRVFSWRDGLILAVAFGLAQAGMVLLGWGLASQFPDVVTGLDHWIAFVLLGVLGAKMLWDAFHPDDAASDHGGIGARELIALATATSIDALAVGIAFSVLSAHVLTAAAVIGVVTLALSLLGVRIGHQTGSRLGVIAEMAGGVILILIGTQILVDHLGVW